MISVRRLSARLLVCLILTAFWTSAAMAAASSGTSDCAELRGLFPVGEGSAAYRPLPAVEPGSDRNLRLRIVARRSDVPVMIGDLPVRGVPLFAETPEGGTSASIYDPALKRARPLPATCLASSAWAYGGTLWSVRQGDDIRVSLSSELDFAGGDVTPPPAGGTNCRGANLHTHGMMVSPYRRIGADGKTLYGDYVLDVAVPDGAGTKDPCDPHHTDAMQSMQHGIVSGGMSYLTHVPGSPGDDERGSGRHPSGLFWFHPHVHGYSGALAAGGTAGMITIGDLGDYVCLKTPDGCRAIAAADATVRTMLLKDAEVAPDHDGWRLSLSRIYALEGSCGSSTGRDVDREGQCSDWQGRRWLFTLNGVRYPQINDVDPAKIEIWRIVNASPNVTYRLRLRPMDGGAPLRMTILSLEGASPVTAGAAEPASTEELLLMPAARAEIAVSAPTEGGEYVLEQQQVATGGDTWPRILLAKVKFPRSTAATGALRVRSGQEADGGRPDRYYSDGVPPGCGFGSSAVRRIYLVQRPSNADDTRRAPIMGLIATTEAAGAAPISFDASGRAAPFDTRAWKALLDGDLKAPGFVHNGLGSICTVLGHRETWIIDNYTAEDHNFHIHQTEFRLAMEHRDDPNYFSTIPPARGSALLAASDQAVATADGEGRGTAEAVLRHDTIPVPRGTGTGGRGCDGSPFSGRCKPGRVTLVVEFLTDSQVGTFVYHCHIMQHEDQGMMALVHVLCPPGDRACGAAHPDDVASRR